MIKLLKILNEVRYINASYKNRDNENPIKDSEVIRVYHGFYSLTSALIVSKYGLSGKERARRVYSYETGNNPYGLYVTIDFKIAASFASSGVIIEFSTKVSDLDSPAWYGGGSYFVQGQYTTSFKDDDDRLQQQLKNREKYSQHEYEPISKSDRPELAQTIFDNYEKQALYIGDLNPNMIKYFWVNDVRMNDRRTDGKWTRYNLHQFIKKYFNLDKIKTSYNSFDSIPKLPSEYNDKDNKIFKPNDNFDINKLKKYMSDNKYDYDNFIKYYVKSKSDWELSTFFWPKQIKQIKNLLDANEL